MHRPDGTSIAVGKPDEVIKKIFRGAEFRVTIAWQKGAGDEVGLNPWPQEYYPGVSNDMNRAGYSRIEADKDNLNKLRTGEAINDPEFILVPFGFLSEKPS